jgi:hypothetical protein
VTGDTSSHYGRLCPLTTCRGRWDRPCRATLSERTGSGRTSSVDPDVEAGSRSCRLGADPRKTPLGQRFLPRRLAEAGRAAVENVTRYEPDALDRCLTVLAGLGLVPGALDHPSIIDAWPQKHEPWLFACRLRRDVVWPHRRGVEQLGSSLGS